MKSTAAVAGLACLLLLLAGCPCSLPDCPCMEQADAAPAPDGLIEPPLDAGPPELAPRIVVHGTTSESGPIGSVYTGQAFSFSAELAEPCPPDLACNYLWDLGNGATSQEANPSLTYGRNGLYHLTLGLTDQFSNDLGSATGVATMWSGQLADSFERAQVDWDDHFWLQPINSSITYTIDSGWLHVEHYDTHAPGSTAIMASPVIRNTHAEVTVRRAIDENVEHYSDVILRMHPQQLNGSFYRVRLKETPAADGNEIDISIFKIFNAEDEHGESLIEPPPIAHGVSRTTNIRLIIDLQDDTQGIPTFNVQFVDADNPSTVLCEAVDVKDHNAGGVPPLSYAGMVGLTQFEGNTWYDDFVVRDLDAP